MLTLSVIIPNTDSALIGKILQALITQTLPLTEYEILVVGSDAPGCVTESGSVRLIRTEAAFCASDKRNLGMRLAKGEIYVFMDDDCLPRPDLLERHLDRHRAGEQVVGGAVTFGTHSYLQTADNVSAFHDLLPHTAAGARSYLCSANLSVNRQVVEKVGPMIARRNRAEDLDWTVRMRLAGYRLYFEPQAIVFHDPARHSLPAVWRHWTGDARDTLTVRLRHRRPLGTPAAARRRSIYLWGAGAIAAWATARSFAHPQTLSTYWHTLPLVYLTKLAWCWGAFTNFPGAEENL